MPTKDDPARLLYPGFTGRVMVDTVRGKVRVRKWPDKRGRPKSAAVRAQNDWFRDANRLASRAPGTQMATAIHITRNSGLYPRDLLMRMMAGNLGSLPLADGSILTKATKRIEPVTFQGSTLGLTSGLAVPAATFTPITWPVPLIDKLSMWSAGAPTRLTIPANVTIITVWGGIVALASLNQLVLHRIWKNGAQINIVANSDFGLNATFLQSAALPVVAGDYFELVAWCSRASTLQPALQTYFSLDVLEAS